MENQTKEIITRRWKKIFKNTGGEYRFTEATRRLALEFGVNERLYNHSTSEEEIINITYQNQKDKSKLTYSLI